MEKTDEAMNYYDESLNINQHHNQALSFKGAALNCYQFLGQLSKQQKFDAAMQCFDQALKIDPKFTDALVGKGIIVDLIRNSESIIIFSL